MYLNYTTCKVLFSQNIFHACFSCNKKKIKSNSLEHEKHIIILIAFYNLIKLQATLIFTIS